MQKLATLIFFESYRSYAKLRDDIKLNTFQQMLLKTLKAIDDEVLAELMLRVDRSPYYATPYLTPAVVLIIQEYVKRVEASEEQERIIAEQLRIEREEILKQRLYPNSAQIADEDRYTNYTLQQFQDEIDWLCKQSLQAQLEGDRERSAALSREASNLSIRQQALVSKIIATMNFSGWKKP